MKQYTIESFHQLMQDETLTFSLSDDVLNVLEYLEKVIEIPEIITTDDSRNGSGHGNTFHGNKHPKSPEFKKKSSGNGRNKIRRNNNYSGDLNRGSNVATVGVDGDTWEMAKPFKSTVFEKKTGIEKIIDDVRINLNKMSHTTYEKQRTMIMEIITAYFENEEYCNDENTHKICNTIFEIASTNKFFSELYVQIYSCLISKYEIFGKYVNDFVIEFDKTMENINYVDPDVNYDGYCIYVKANEKRQSTTTFVVNMMKRGLVLKETIIQIIRDFINIVMQYIDIENKTKEVEEIVENIYILYVQMHGLMTNVDDSCWDSIKCDVQKLGQSFSKEYLSLSNRAIFKFMDMVELDG